MRPYSKTVYPTGPIPQVVPSAFTTAPPPRYTESPGISLIPGNGLPPTEPALYDIPLTSSMVKESATATRLTCVQRDQWARDNLPSRIQVALATPFCKDLSLHALSAAIEFRHVLLFIFRSGYLNNRSSRALLNASPLARQLDEVIAKYGTLDFTPLRLGIRLGLATPALITQVKGLVTACFLHFKFDTPSVVRYICGQHLAAHRDVPAIIRELRRAEVDPAVLADLERVF
jgi:hypothetical protein